MAAAIAAQFGVTRPKERYNQRLTVAVSMDKADARNIPDYVSTKMAVELQNWLITAPRAGNFYDLLGAYHGQVRLRDRELGRRLELVGKVRDGRVQYDPRWPQAVMFLLTYISQDPPLRSRWTLREWLEPALVIVALMSVRAVV